MSCWLKATHCSPTWSPEHTCLTPGLTPSQAYLVQHSVLHASGELSLALLQGILRRLELGQQRLVVPGVLPDALNADALLLVDG